MTAAGLRLASTFRGTRLRCIHPDLLRVDQPNATAYRRVKMQQEEGDSLIEADLAVSSEGGMPTDGKAKTVQFLGISLLLGFISRHCGHYGYTSTAVCW